MPIDVVKHVENTPYGAVGDSLGATNKAKLPRMCPYLRYLRLEITKDIRIVP